MRYSLNVEDVNVEYVDFMKELKVVNAFLDAMCDSFMLAYVVKKRWSRIDANT